MLLICFLETKRLGLAAVLHTHITRSRCWRAIEQAEMPFGWRLRFRTECEYLRRRSWISFNIMKLFFSFGPGERERASRFRA